MAEHDIGHAGKRRRLRQRAEDIVEQDGETVAIDGADDGDLQAAPLHDGAMKMHEVVARDGGDAVLRAARGAAIDMAFERQLTKRLCRKRIGIIGLGAQAGQHLRARALDGVGVEAGRIDRELQQAEGRIHVARHRLQAAVKRVAVGGEGNLDRLVVHRIVEGLGIEIARALVHQGGKHGGGAHAAGRVLRGAAGQRKFHRDERHGIIFDQPGLDAALQNENLHARGACSFGNQAAVRGVWRVHVVSNCKFASSLQGAERRSNPSEGTRPKMDCRVAFGSSQ